MRPKSIESGASQMARNSSPTCTMISDTELRIPPAATADDRSRPFFCRNRTCIAVSAATGTARLENDIADCSSMLGHTGRRMGTLPRNVMPNATSVADAEHEREQHEPPVGVLHRVPEHLGVAHPAQQHADADRARPTAISRLRGCTRKSRRSSGASVPVAAAPTCAELVEAVVELVAPAEARRGSSPRAPAACSIGSAAATVSLAHDPHRGRDRALGPDDRRGRGQQLGDVAGGLAEPGAAGREVEADDARGVVPSTSTCLPSSLPCATRAVCSVRSSAQRAVEQRVAHRVGVEVVELGARDLLDDEQRERAVRAGDDDARRVDARVARQQLRYASYSTCARRLGTSVGGASRYATIAPRAREELGVGFVAPEGDDAHRSASVGASATNTARPTGCSLVGARRVTVDAECLRARPSTCGTAGRPTGVPKSVLDRVGDAPAEHDGGDQVGGEPAREVEAREREQRHEALAEAPGRPGEVR